MLKQHLVDLNQSKYRALSSILRYKFVVCALDDFD